MYIAVVSHCRRTPARAGDRTQCRAGGQPPAVQYSDVPYCHPVLSISKMLQFLQSWNCFDCFIKSRYQQVRRRAARAASCSRPAFDCNSGAGWRARCSRRRRGVFPLSCRLCFFLDLVEINRHSTLCHTLTGRVEASCSSASPLPAHRVQPP